MTIKKIFPFALLLMTMVFFTACDKDTDEDMEEYSQNTASQQASFMAAAHQSEGDGGTALGEMQCFTVNYPVTIIFPGGNTLAVNSDEEFEQAIDDWYLANEDSEEDPTLEFPVTITLEDGSEQSVTDEDTLCELFDECYGEDDEDEEEDEDHEGCEFEFDECFELNFPVTLILPDGTSSEINDLETLEDAVDMYYDQNPDDENEPSFNYPIEVTLEDGTIQSVSNDEELELLFESCDDEDDDEEYDEEECFDFVYPITITLPDGASSSVNDYDELENFVDNYYDQNPDDESDPMLSYPVDILFDDETTMTVSSDEELEAAEDDCE